LMTRRAEAGAEGAMWIPAVDVAETEDAINVKVEAPGVKKDDIKISVTNNVLTVRGEKKMEKETSEENYHRIERVYGSFVRSLELPTVVRANKVKASFKDGVLTIVLPKSEEVKPKEIAIESE
jgi:HSP20 family protein